MLAKLNSRKLWLTVGTVVTIICAAQAGQITWHAAEWPLVVAVLGYVGVQGVIDLCNLFVPKSLQSFVDGLITKALGNIPLPTDGAMLSAPAVEPTPADPAPTPPTPPAPDPTPAPAATVVPIPQAAPTLVTWNADGSATIGGMVFVRSAAQPGQGV